MATKKLTKETFIKDASKLIKKSEKLFFVVYYTNHNSEHAYDSEELWEIIQEIMSADDYDAEEYIDCEVFKTGRYEAEETGSGIIIENETYKVY